LNSSNVPINQHSLKALELWLQSLGAIKDSNSPSIWHLNLSNWEAIISFEQEDLSVTWNCDGKLTKRLFSYCINKEDVENAILQGP
tara:strand:- start:530 stop:787 length:258 start_codon:yes stop_codon:yes gene_type:complete